jgi:hypothetical protein
MARPRRQPRKKGDNIVWPLTEFGVESINKNFDALFKDTQNLGQDRLLSGIGVDTLLGVPVRGDLIVAQLLPAEFEPKWARFEIGAANTVLRTSGVDPEWNKVHLTTDVDEILPVANGGTNNDTYTAGSVIFAGASGLVLEEDNANFFWDDSNDRLGLGTAAPTVRFDLNVNAGGTALALGARIANVTAATSGATRQYSPALVYSGTAWDTDGAGSSVTHRFAFQLRTVSGAITANYLAISRDEGSGVFADDFLIGSALAGDAPSIRFRDGNLIFRNASRGIYFTANPLTDAAPTSHFIAGGGSNGRIDLTPLVGGSEGFVNIDHNQFGFATGTIPAINLRGFDSSTTSPIPGPRLRSVPGGTAGVGFGGSIWFQASSNPTGNRDQGYFDCVWSDATDATRSADFVMRLVNSAAAAAEIFRFASTGLATIPSLNLSSGSLGNVLSGVYTPTRSAETNLDSNVTLTEAQYVRVRNTVTVSGRFTADPTAAATPTSFEMTLPVASNIGAAEDVAGVAFCGSIAGQGAEITGSVANNTAVVSWISGDVTSQSWSFTFTYQVI